jgi:hypothetical protein
VTDPVVTPSLGSTVGRCLDNLGDSDYIGLNATPGASYRVEASNLGPDFERTRTYVAFSLYKINADGTITPLPAASSWPNFLVTPSNLSGRYGVVIEEPFFNDGGPGFGYDVRVTAQTAQPRVGSFTLINADTDRPVAGYDPIANGATINLAKLPTRNLAIRANADPAAAIGSVRIALDGAARVEEAAPYSACGDDAGDYKACRLPVGTHFVRATPFTGPNVTGIAGISRTVSFEVVSRR